MCRTAGIIVFWAPVICSLLRVPRASEPTAPSWLHDPERAAAQLRRFTFEKACAVSQSDQYKERGLRHEMWNHLLGKAPAPDGR